MPSPYLFPDYSHTMHTIPAIDEYGKFLRFVARKISLRWCDILIFVRSFFALIFAVASIALSNESFQFLAVWPFFCVTSPMSENTHICEFFSYFTVSSVLFNMYFFAHNKLSYCYNILLDNPISIFPPLSWYFFSQVSSICTSTFNCLIFFQVSSLTHV